MSHGSLGLSPSPPGAGVLPAAAAYLAGPAAAGAGAGGEHPFPLPAGDPRGAGPAAQMGPEERYRYPRNPAGDRMVPPGSIARLAAAGDLGAQLLRSVKGERKESPLLDGTMEQKLHDLIEGIDFAREHYGIPGPKITMRTLFGIVKGTVAIPAYLRSAVPLPPIGSTPDTSQWGDTDYKFYRELQLGVDVLYIYKKVHVRENTYDALLLVVFGAHGPEMFMSTPDTAVAETIPGALITGGRRRRTRRITKASRYPRSGIRSRVRRRVRG